MVREQILSIIKTVVTEGVTNADPSQKKEIQAIQEKMNSEITMDTPLSSIGLDSLQMTWLIVSLENKLNLDASCISFFDLYSIGDLVNSLHELTTQEQGKVIA